MEILVVGLRGEFAQFRRIFVFVLNEMLNITVVVMPTTAKRGGVGPMVEVEWVAVHRSGRSFHGSGSIREHD